MLHARLLLPQQVLQVDPAVPALQDPVDLALCTSVFSHF
jgi:hypothetical protein